MRVAPRVDLSEDDRAVLLRWSRGKRTEARLVVRAKTILAAAVSDNSAGLQRSRRSSLCVQRISATASESVVNPRYKSFSRAANTWAASTSIDV